jgi:hypothetical protein
MTRDAEARALSTDAADVDVAREAIQSAPTAATLPADAAGTPPVDAAPAPAPEPVLSVRELPPEQSSPEVAREAAAAVEAALAAATAPR